MYLYVETMSQLDTQISSVIDPISAARLADIFNALADPTRLRIISTLLQQEQTVNEIARLVEMSQPATSHHLRFLRAQRIVRTRKVGRQVFYALDDDHIHDLLERGLAHLTHE